MNKENTLRNLYQNLTDEEANALLKELAKVVSEKFSQPEEKITAGWNGGGIEIRSGEFIQW